MKKAIALLSLMFLSGVLLAQQPNKYSQDLRISPHVEGTLLKVKSEKVPLVILIGGSGPIDRDGNQLMTQSNSLKYLAEGLFKNEIASFRYDKRIVKMMKRGSVDERTISFDDFIEDARQVIDFFDDNPDFTKIVVCGHSQGSLVGMIAASDKADAFISLAGAGQPIDSVIVDQLAKQAPGLKENARASFRDLRETGKASNFSPGLSSIFRESLQPFLISWMKHDPGKIIAGLDMPVLIVNGDKDLQVQVSEAELLHAAKPGARLKIVRDMNHVLKRIEGDDIDNSKSYNEPGRPLHPDLVELLSSFIKSN